MSTPTAISPAMLMSEIAPVAKPIPPSFAAGPSKGTWHNRARAYAATINPMSWIMAGMMSERGGEVKENDPASWLLLSSAGMVGVFGRGTLGAIVGAAIDAMHCGGFQWGR